VTFVSKIVSNSDTQLSLDCTCLGRLGQHVTDIGQGKYIRRNNACDMASDITLNVANVNTAEQANVQDFSQGTLKWEVSLYH
jgi:hypothetical protein